MGEAQHIVLLDNDASIVELISWFLDSKGFRVRVASSFGELDALLSEGPCDLLLSDVDLGAESALVELPQRSAAGTLPRTLVVSGFLDANNQAVLDAVPEVVGTLAKPFEFDDLEVTVRAALVGGGSAGQGSGAQVPGGVEAVGGAAAGVPSDAPAADQLPAPVPPAPSAGAAPHPGPVASVDPPADDDGWIEIGPPA